MKILKHGKFYVEKQIIECELCGCTFEITDADKEIVGRYEFSPYNRSDMSFRCPECNSTILACDVYKYSTKYEGLINDLMYIEEERSGKNGND